MEACYGGTDVMERSCAVARGIDINMAALGPSFPLSTSPGSGFAEFWAKQQGGCFACVAFICFCSPRLEQARSRFGAPASTQATPQKAKAVSAQLFCAPLRFFRRRYPFFSR
jgi:hypothetical protein